MADGREWRQFGFLILFCARKEGGMIDQEGGRWVDRLDSSES